MYLVAIVKNNSEVCLQLGFYAEWSFGRFQAEILDRPFYHGVEQKRNMTFKKTVLFSIAILTAFGCKNNSQSEEDQNSGEKRFDSLIFAVPRLMKENNLNGLSVAVIKDFQIDWTKEFGVKAGDSDEKVDEDTAYSSASIAKGITALICVVLEQNGLINLDEPISKYLKRWQIPENKFTKNTPVTWKHLLSHTAGTSQSGFTDFYGNDTIPTIVQSLKGELLPNYDKEIEILFEPGTDSQYSGGGFVIVQLALEDYLKKPMFEIAKTYLFDPLGLENTSMVQPNEIGFLTNVAKVHNSDGSVIRTGLPICPQVAPSGLWSTPTDLAQITIEIQKALENKGSKILSQKSAEKLIGIITYKHMSGGALGWQRSFAFGNRDWISITGANTGVGGEINGTISEGKGIVILANGGMGNRLPVMNFLRSEIIKLYGWEKKLDKNLFKPIPRELSEKLTGTYYDFLYGGNKKTTIQAKNTRLFITSELFQILQSSEENEMFYLGNNTFAIDQYPNMVKFIFDAEGQVREFEIFREENHSRRLRIPYTKVKQETN